MRGYQATCNVIESSVLLPVYNVMLLERLPTYHTHVSFTMGHGRHFPETQSFSGHRHFVLVQDCIDTDILDVLTIHIKTTFMEKYLQIIQLGNRIGIFKKGTELFIPL